MPRKYTFTGKHCKKDPFYLIRKVNDINPDKYKQERVTELGFKKYNPGTSLEDQVKQNEGIICSFYGCKKELSLRQQMAGDRCEDHPKEEIQENTGKELFFVSKVYNNIYLK